MEPKKNTEEFQKINIKPSTERYKIKRNEYQATSKSFRIPKITMIDKLNKKYSENVEKPTVLFRAEEKFLME